MSEEKTPKMKFDETCEDVKTKLEEACDDVKTKIDEACEDVRTKIDEACDDVRTKIDEACEDVKTKLDEACEDVKSMAKGLLENEGMKTLLKETKHKLFVAREKLRYLLCKVLTKRDGDADKEPESPTLRGREAALKEFEGATDYNSLKILSNLERAVRNVLDRQDSSIMKEETGRTRTRCDVVDNQILITDFDTYVAVLETMFATIVRADHYMQNCLTEDIRRARQMAIDGADSSQEIAEMEEELKELGVISEYVSSFQEYMRKSFHEAKSEENAAKEMSLGEEASGTTNVIGSLGKAEIPIQDPKDRLNPSLQGTAEEPFQVGSGAIYETTEPEITCQELINGMDGIVREMHSRACQLREKRKEKLLSRYHVTVDQKLPEVPVDQKLPEVPVDQKLPEVPVDQGLIEVPVDQGLIEDLADQGLIEDLADQGLIEDPVDQELIDSPEELSYTDYYDNQSLIDSSDDETCSVSPDQLSPIPAQLTEREFLRNAAAIALTGPLLQELHDAVGKLERTNETLHHCLERVTAAKQTGGKKR